MGLVTKTLTFSLAMGKLAWSRVITLKVNMPPPGAGSAQLSAADRKAAMLRAAANPQAIFRGECAKCHVDKGARAFGQDLYAADCGICHESSHRDSVVPDLHALKQPSDLEYWKVVITYGKPHTMMPGFARSLGGPLSDEQIGSLALYLDRTISHHFLQATMTNAAAAPPAKAGKAR
jgi:mono/diheme cytochrome c family protein